MGGDCDNRKMSSETVRAEPHRQENAKKKRIPSWLIHSTYSKLRTSTNSFEASATQELGNKADLANVHEHDGQRSGFEIFGQYVLIALSVACGNDETNPIKRYGHEE